MQTFCIVSLRKFISIGRSWNCGRNAWWNEHIRIAQLYDWPLVKTKRSGRKAWTILRPPSFVRGERSVIIPSGWVWRKRWFLINNGGWRVILEEVKRSWFKQADWQIKLPGRHAWQGHGYRHGPIWKPNGLIWSRAWERRRHRVSKSWDSSEGVTSVLDNYCDRGFYPCYCWWCVRCAKSGWRQGKEFVR